MFDSLVYAWSKSEQIGTLTMEDAAPYDPEGDGTPPPTGLHAPFDTSAHVEAYRERIRRLPEIISEHLTVRVTARQIALALGTSAQNLRNYGTTKQAPSSFVQGIAARYPFISLRWLLLGEGEPIEARPIGGADIASTLMRLGAERQVVFERLSVEQVSEGGVDYVKFDAAGRLKA